MEANVLALPFARPSISELLPVMQLVLAVERHPEYIESEPHYQDLVWLLEHYEGDVRRTLLHLQLWLWGTSDPAAEYLFRRSVAPRRYTSVSEPLALLCCQVAGAIASGQGCSLSLRSIPLAMAFMNQVGHENTILLERTAIAASISMPMAPAETLHGDEDGLTLLESMARFTEGLAALDVVISTFEEHAPDECREPSTPTVYSAACHSLLWEFAATLPRSSTEAASNHERPSVIDSALVRDPPRPEACPFVLTPWSCTNATAIRDYYSALERFAHVGCCRCLRSS